MGEGCSQRICSELDPPRQGSRLVIQVTPVELAGRQGGRGHPLPYFFLSSPLQLTGPLFPPSLASKGFTCLSFHPQRQALALLAET